jgi:(E)-4-hydroxy-3-methylbut-2-enyl-diphosphate synthase
MYLRENTRKVKIKDLEFGSNILIQTMLTTKTSNVAQVIKEINYLESIGCDIIRVSCLDELDVDAIKEIVKNINIPLVCDIHYNYKYAIKAIENGCHKIRINPGNIGEVKNVEEIIQTAKKYNVPIRIGINSGSLPKGIPNTPLGMVDTAGIYISMFERLGFFDIVVSLKGSNIDETYNACLLFSKQYDYPQHIGITEAGPMPTGVVKSTIGISKILNAGIGNTIRVSLTDDPINEVLAAKSILKYNNLLNKPSIDVISCPTCGRTIFDIKNIIKEVELFCATINKQLTISILACVVNGIGEGKGANIGIACSKDYSLLFIDGIEIKKIENKDVLTVLKEEIIKY